MGEPGEHYAENSQPVTRMNTCTTGRKAAKHREIARRMFRGFQNPEEEKINGLHSSG